MASATPHISLHVTVYIKPDDVPEFFKAFKPVLEKVAAEPECTFFQVYQNPESPGTLTWVENWHVAPSLLQPPDVLVLRRC